MSGDSDYLARAILNWQVGKTAFPALPTAYLALFTAMGIDAGTGFTEPAAGAYARKQTAAADWNAATGSAPATISNANAFTFPTATADWGTIIGFGLFDAATGGNLLDYDWLGPDPWKPFDCSLASPGLFTVRGHGFANADKVVCSAEVAGSLPAGISAATLLTVAGVATDTFNVGVNTTSVGNGLLRRVVSQACPTGVALTFPAGSLVFTRA